MAAKAYVSSMTVAELTSELKKRGLNCRGKKKALQNRLEQALYEEENSETSSEGSNNEATIRAASAVIDQLEGNANEILELTTPTTPSPCDKTPLIVSIEHSKRHQIETNGERGGEPPPIVTNDTGQIEERIKERETEEGDKKQETTEQENTTYLKKDTPAFNDVPLISDTPQPEENTVIMETVAKQPIVTPEMSGPTTPEKAPPTSDIIMASPAQQETETESEVNSVAVEPPSPSRDEITFSVDVSLSEEMVGEEEGMTVDLPMEEGGGQMREGDKNREEQREERGEDSREEDKDEVVSFEEERVQFSRQQPDDTNGNDNNEVKEGREREEEERGGEGGGVSCALASNEVDYIVTTNIEEEEEEFTVFANEAFSTSTLASDTPTKLYGEGREEGLMGGINNKNEPDRKRQGSVDEKDNKDTVNAPSKRRRISTSPKKLQERKRRWGSSTSNRTPTSSQPAISSDTLENIIPEEVKEEVAEVDMNAVVVPSEEEGEVPHTMEEDSFSANPLNITTVSQSEERDEEERGGGGDKQDEEDIVELGKDSSMLMDEYEKEWQEKEKEKEQQRREIGRARKEIETRKSLDERHIEEPIKRTRPIPRRSPSPPSNPPSRILHVEHLKRPFTILQLKELLQENGPMIEGGFWTNKIKSHCIVIFLSTDIAVATRNRLHGMKWPSTNPQLLRVDFLTNKQVSEVSEGSLIIDSRSPSPAKEVGVSVGGAKTESSTSEKKPPVENKEKSSLVVEKKEVVQAPPTKEEKATRMLDDLFNKTKATPPIYWMPLTKEEMEKKATERQIREKEREKRREERRKEQEEQLEKERRERSNYRNRGSPRRRSPRRRSRSPRRSRSRSPRRR